jgi:hypothetical protein
MTRSIEDVARDAAPFLAELIRKYPPRPAAARPDRDPASTGQQDRAAS